MNRPPGTDRFLPPGTRVRHDGLGPGQSEHGIVVHCWLDDEIGVHDCYVAFFGTRFPDGRPSDKPYLLRYAAISLTVLEPRGAHAD